MKAADHSRELEQVMAYVDGALDAVTADGVRRHIAGCGECRQAEEDLRRVSGRLQSWEVGAAPDRLQPPTAVGSKQSPRRVFPEWLLTGRGLTAAAASISMAVVVGAALWQPRKGPSVAAVQLGDTEREVSERVLVRPELAFKDARASVGAQAPRGAALESPAETMNKGPMVVRTARLSIIASDVDAARAELERIVQHVGGFIGSMGAEGAKGSSRRLEATLRVPTSKLDEALVALRRLGQVVSEAQDGEDVTQQSADLNTRLENARVSEKRLRDILAQRTGRLSDVLDVEREIGRVRGEIEQMESQRRSLDRRVSYATVAVSLSEDRKAEVNFGPVPVSRRFRNAFVEGWTTAIASGVEATLFLIEVLPTLLLWTAILAPAALFIRRRFVRVG